MGKDKKTKKSKRKGKKAWRVKISTEDISDSINQSNKDALSGGSLSHLPSHSLFFLDKSQDLSVKRKIEKHREKVLRCDSILQPNPFVQPVPSSLSKKKKKLNKVVADAASVDAGEDGHAAPAAASSGMIDLWDNEGEENSHRKTKVSKPSVIPAVEVEAPGCSYNPHFDAHQDALAEAVAEEMKKVYQKELEPEPIPLTVDWKVGDEEDMYFLDADNSDNDGDANTENLIENDDTASEKKSAKMKVVTRVELNRRARRKEEQKKEVEAKKKDELLKEIDSLQDIMKEIEKEDEEKEKRHLRRVAAKQESLKIRPPRLGKHKFVPAPAQVLLSEEITGSLRKLKGCCTLLRDRFKSLEKRGLIPPSGNNRRI